MKQVESFISIFCEHFARLNLISHFEFLVLQLISFNQLLLSFDL